MVSWMSGWIYCTVAITRQTCPQFHAFHHNLYSHFCFLLGCCTHGRLQLCSRQPHAPTTTTLRARYRFQSRRGMIADAVQGCGMWWNKSTATAWCYHVNTDMRIQCHDGIYKYLLKFLKPQRHFCILLVFNWHLNDGCWSWWVCITCNGDTNPLWSLFKLEWALVLYNAAVTWL